MKTILINWLIVQLIMIWIAYWDWFYQLSNKTVNCNEIWQWDKKDYMILWAMFPLLAFNTMDSQLIQYCNNKK